MARTYSRNAEPHRILFDTGAGAQRGDDIRALRNATQRRLDARGIDRTIGPADGILREPLVEAMKTAAHFLGAPDEWTESKSGVLVREQRIIRYPGTRTQEMLDAADDRMARLIADREAAEKRRKVALAAAAARDAGGVSGLNTEQRIRARQIAVAAFALCYRNRGNVHYTRGVSRWQGIASRRRFADGAYPNWADCSSMYTWCLWNALTSVSPGFRDVVNGSNWTAGYTGTIASHGKWVAVSDLLPGDAVLYGRGFPYNHVTMYAGNGMCYSHGSESGPYYLPVNYRPISTCRRFI